ncbi:DUF1499 domain-containing protein [Rhizobium sp. YIM 134829]|uniref:DUF1499 domain-containing protein n=1 Tax=Rhizobium sp. YIM 134829 TaxID=3390453 RepID=UPI003978DB52
MITYERPVSLAALWARRLARLAFGIFVFSLAAHRFGPVDTSSFVALVLLSAALALIGVLLAIIGLVRLWQVAAIGGVASVAALFYALLPLGVAGYALESYATKPALSDVTTDLADPPPWIRPPEGEKGWLKPRAPGPADRAAQAEAYPALTGRRYEGALDRVLAGVRKVGDQMGIRLTDEQGVENAERDIEDLGPAGKLSEEPPGDDGPVPIPMARPEMILPEDRPTGLRASDILLQGEWRSLVVGARYDLVIRLREEAETTFVDIRTAARFGPHDLGTSAAIAERFLHALDAELLGIAGD